jgi:hypothetical protein
MPARESEGQRALPSRKQYYFKGSEKATAVQWVASRKKVSQSFSARQNTGHWEENEAGSFPPKTLPNL